MIFLITLLILFFFESTQHKAAEQQWIVQPYHVQLRINSTVRQSVFIDYDYGYGFISSHRRQFAISPNENNLTFSVSAWKPVLAWRVSFSEPGKSKINALSIIHNGKKHSSTSDTLLKISQKEVLLLNGPAWDQFL